MEEMPLVYVIVGYNTVEGDWWVSAAYLNREKAESHCYWLNNHPLDENSRYDLQACRLGE